MFGGCPGRQYCVDMFGSYHIGAVLGIPLRVHITLIIFLPLIAIQIAAVMGIQSILWGLIAAVGLFASVALHELGHAVVAMQKGIRVRQILLLPIGGLAQLEGMTDEPRDEMHIAFAGPVVSFMLAVFFGLWARLFAGPEPGLIIYMLLLLSGMNLVLAIFNLLPSFPMDGGRIFRAWLTPRLGRVAATLLAAKIGRFMAIVLGIWGFLQFSILTIAVAVFIYMAAGAEYRMVVLQERLQRPFGGFGSPPPPTSPPEDDETIVVGPPPYARKGPDPSAWWRDLMRRPRRLFDHLFDDWSKP